MIGQLAKLKMSWYFCEHYTSHEVCTRNVWDFCSLLLYLCHLLNLVGELGKTETHIEAESKISSSTCVISTYIEGCLADYQSTILVMCTLWVSDTHCIQDSSSSRSWKNWNKAKVSFSFSWCAVAKLWTLLKRSLTFSIFSTICSTLKVPLDSSSWAKLFRSLSAAWKVQVCSVNSRVWLLHRAQMITPAGSF